MSAALVFSLALLLSSLLLPALCPALSLLKAARLLLSAARCIAALSSLNYPLNWNLNVMSCRAKYICEMTDQEHWTYMETCEHLHKMLQAALDLIMGHIFTGQCRDPSQWEDLFKAAMQAQFMKEYLGRWTGNLVPIAEDFLAQVADWKAELEQKLK